RAASDLVHELEAFALLVGIDVKLHVSILSATTGLSNIFAFRLGMLANRLAIGHLRFANVRFHLVLANHAVNDDLQVKLTHAADDGLSRIGISVNLKGRIFLSKTAKRHAHFFLVALGLGFNCYRNYRLGKFYGFEEDWGFF